jgi:putative inorganic carbon (HCO3(-)) transporter
LSNDRFENPGVFVIGGLFFVPFVLYGTGLVGVSHLIAGLTLVIFLTLLLMNFEIGFLSLIFIRSSLDFMKSFSEQALNLAALISLALIVLGVFYVLYRRTNILQFEDSKPFLVFLGICGLSITYSPDAKESLSDWLRLLSIFSAYILTRLVFITENKIKMALVAILMSALLPVFVAYFQLATGVGTVMDGGQARIVGTFLHPNAFASYLLIILIFCASQLLEGTSLLNKGFLAFLTTLVFITFVFTLSRGAWIVFILAMGLMGVLRYRKLLGLLPPLLLLTIVAVPAVRDRILNIFEPNQYAAGRSAWEWRLDTWEEIGQLVQEKPLLGHGLSMVEVEFQLLTHNDYLRLVTEVGAVGLLAYVFLLFNAWRWTAQDYQVIKFREVKSFQVGIMAMIAAFFVRSFADNSLRNTVVMIYFWVLIALLRNLTLLCGERTPSGKLKVAEVGAS